MHNFAENGRCAPQSHGHEASDRYLEHPDRGISAIEEAILNALLAAQSVPTFKPAGLVLEALDHGQLLELLREYRRLPDPKDP